jgi:hypothetical protein
LQVLVDNGLHAGEIAAISGAYSEVQTFPASWINSSSGNRQSRSRLLTGQDNIVILQQMLNLQFLSYYTEYV